jgi:hypothetical protein
VTDPVVQLALEKITAPTVAAGKLSCSHEQLYVIRHLSPGMGTPAIAGYTGIGVKAAFGTLSLIPCHRWRPLPSGTQRIFGNSFPGDRPHDVAFGIHAFLLGWSHHSVWNDCSRLSVGCLHGTSGAA